MESARIPARMPARFSDRINVSMGTVFVPEIHLRLSFDRALDRPRMARALRLLLDAEPVLGCRFVHHWRSPWWERLPEAVLDGAELLFFAGEDGERAEKEFLARLWDVEKGPQVACLLVPEGEGERLVLKVHHATCDAGGLKAMAARLAEIYRELAADPGYRPEPAVGSRSLRQVYGRFSPGTLLAVLWRGLVELRHGVRPFKSLQVRVGKKGTRPREFLFKRISSGEAGRFLRAGARYAATANDLFVAAVFRALKRIAGEGGGALRLAGTVDMRRYLPGRRADSLCQVSGLYTVCVGADPGPDFASTLAAVREVINEQKARHFGLGLMFFLWLCFGAWPWFAYRRFVPVFWGLGHRDGNIGPGFTNLGPIPVLDFGAARVEAAEMTTPAAVPPFFFAGVSGFAGGFCISSGFWPDAVSPERVEAFLEAVRQELLSFAEAHGE